mmetsp:Transcript_40315/g.101255  ORF Transcript_40315/g.101255 Transcript_40315/m.101255 type:complete len:157 (-) Transcript_40315:126-596(-)
MPTIAPGVDFKCVAREWRCKFSDENDMAALKVAQRLLDDMTVDILGVVKEWVGKQAKTREVLNGQIDCSKQLVQRIVCTECNDFKVVVKLPLDQFSSWEKAAFEPEAKFLQALGEIEGISNIETQTYTLETVNLMGKIKVPKASEGCMADSLPVVS